MTPPWGVHVNQSQIDHLPFSLFSVHPFTHTSPHSTSVEPVRQPMKPNTKTAAAGTRQPRRIGM